MDKVKIFNRELSLIRSDAVRNIVMLAINNVSDAFFTEAASSTGKHHPAYGLGEGGLLRHTKAVVSFANMFTQYCEMHDYWKDVIIAACILHDTCKRGIKFENDYTQHSHPMLVWHLLDANKMDEKTRRIWADINNLISTHMGQWRNSSYDTMILPEISNKTQMIVHWSDYIGSRKYINIRNEKYGKLLDYRNKQWSGTNEEIFSEELKWISDSVIRKMVKRALKEDRYAMLSEMSITKSIIPNYRKQGGIVTNIKTVLLIVKTMLELEKTFVDRHDADILFASVFISHLGYTCKTENMSGEEVAYWNEILYNKKSLQCRKAATWEQMILLVAEKIAVIPKLDINVIPEKKKEYKPATDKQVYRIKQLIEEFSKAPGYDGRYDSIKPDKLSIGQAGKYISEMKKIQAQA